MNNIFDQLASAGAPQDPSSDSDPHAIDASDHHPLADNSNEDATLTSPAIKSIVQDLLKHGYLEESGQQDLLSSMITNLTAINAALEPLDLLVKIDSFRGVAFLAVASDRLAAELEEEGWNHPLVRRQRLTLEQSLLVAILRQTFVMHEQECGVGQVAAKVTVDELLAIFLTYFGDSGSDSKDENRLLQLLDQLKSHGIVSEVDKQHEITIRPLIAHLANPESLTALLSVFKEKRLATTESEADL